jgi:hypothetical protein
MLNLAATQPMVLCLPGRGLGVGVLAVDTANVFHVKHSSVVPCVKCGSAMKGKAKKDSVLGQPRARKSRSVAVLLRFTPF